MESMKKHSPLIFAVLVVWGLALQAYLTSLRENAGLLVYGLDDAYIHMAIAKNFAEHGVWGVTRHGFTSSTSSVLWTLMLALAYKAFGVVYSLPYLLNVVFASLTVVVADGIMRRWVTPGAYRFAALGFLILAAPFAPLITGGMEHTLQALILLAFAWCSARALSEEDSRPWAGWTGLMFALAPLIAFVRYECAFLALMVCILVFLRRRWFQSVALGLLVLVPVVIYGWISHRNGWYFFPNSVLLKSGVMNPEAGDTLLGIFGQSAFSKLVDNPHLLFLVFLALTTYALRAGTRAGAWEERQNFLLIFAGATFLHMQFAEAGWFYRYESYLMVVGIVAVTAAWSDFAPELRASIRGAYEGLPRNLTILFLTVLLLIPALDRGLKAYVESTQAMNDRYLEHIMTARFIKQFYEDDIVMVNDIGAVCFYTEGRILDIYGLGSLEPAKFRREPGGYRPDDLLNWAEAEGGKIAILQVEWAAVHQRIPKEWILVGEWEIPRNVVFGDTKMGWYAVNEEEAERLMGHLREFAPQLPIDVEQRGRYRGDEEEREDAEEEAAGLRDEREERLEEVRPAVR
jgi:hypothetical protein